MKKKNNNFILLIINSHYWKWLRTFKVLKIEYWNNKVNGLIFIKNNITVADTEKPIKLNAIIETFELLLIKC